MSIANHPTGQPERAAVRRQQAFELRMRGASHRAIAKQLGCAITTVGSDLRKELARLAAQTQASAEALRTMELERLGLAMRAIAKKVQEGDLPAVDRWLRLCESRRRLLGLDAQPQLFGGTDLGSGGPGITFVLEQLAPVPTGTPAEAPALEMIDVEAVPLPPPPLEPAVPSGATPDRQEPRAEEQDDQD